ncbi:hypothetical protein BD324DRAFT_648161 [Kockovaella imperatae]|uniref:HIG1 domain-containing protein n=1 Tax=Kockovaella imperatae TaxID=4999 RepID=A0A1Y1UUI6_9TREE|nr:hypothetical protein BD324DRAFT_648161 [Kockovaella imperatae]ORX41287.1 hypothetical protein BD324DRAFT_648161 [Kockovaella imperatae]
MDIADNCLSLCPSHFYPATPCTPSPYYLCSAAAYLPLPHHQIVTAEHEREHQDATVVGGLKGAAIAASIIAPFHLAMRKYSTAYRAIPTPLKAFGFVTVGVFTINFAAEKSGEAYDQSQWSGAGQNSIDAKTKARDAQWEQMGMLEKAGDFAIRWKFPLIVGSWAGVLGGSYLWISRNKAMTVPQRLVQARIYAQAWSILCVIAALAPIGTANDKNGRAISHHHPAEDHSWKDIIAQNEAAAKVEAERRSQESDPTAVLRAKKVPVAQ